MSGGWLQGESNGMEGGVAARTRLSHVDGGRGELAIAGLRLEEFPERATFQESTWLLWNGSHRERFMGSPRRSV